MDWWTQHKDAIIAISAVFGAVITIAGGIWVAIKWGFLRQWQRRLRVDVNVFEVISDPAILVPRLYATENDNSPLADHNIKYQPRDPNRDLQAELKAVLNRSRYLLVTAPTGYGKTREAGVLTQTMMLEGWRVLLIKNTGWLDVPKTLPAELNNNRSRVLIFLDDINGLFSTGERTQSPRAEKIPMLSEPSYHDRLLQVLDMLEAMCTKKEIRVIATARSESDQWSVLNFNPKDKLWRRFERIELSGPINAAIVNLLEDSTKQADLKANPDDFIAIANKSDGTYRNILLNLRRWHAQSKEVDENNFTETLEGSWRDIYQRAVNQHPAVQFVYDAIDILRQSNVNLIPSLVNFIAVEIWGGNMLQKFVHQIEVQLAIDYLTQETKILRLAEDTFTPGEGQIEAKDTKPDWRNYTLVIERSILKQIPAKSLLQTYLLFSFGFQCLEVKDKQDAIRVWRNIPTDKLSDLFNRIEPRVPGFKNFLQSGINLKPGPYVLHLLLGFMLEDLNRLTEAEEIYRQFLSENPNDAYAQAKLGDVLRYLERYQDAEEAYSQAIRIDPNYAYSYTRLGSLLRVLERYSEAEGFYIKALAKDPNDVFTYWRFGILLIILRRYVEAEAIFRQAISKGANDSYIPYIMSDLGSALAMQGRYNDALVAYNKAIELDSFSAKDYFSLGLLLQKLKRYDEAEIAYRKAIEEGLNDPYLFRALGLVLRLEGKFLESMEFLTKSQEMLPRLESVLSLAGTYKQLKNRQKTIENINKAREIIEQDDWYNLACLESIANNIEIAFDYLKLAKTKEGFDYEWAWEDPDLQWIRDDPRFIEIVGPKPEKKNSEA